MDINFKKIFFSKGKVRLAYDKKEDDGGLVPTTKTFKAPPHDDFLQALANLRIHWVMLVGYTSPAKVQDAGTPKSTIVEDCEVYGVTYGGAQDDPGVTIAGQRKTQLEKIVEINAPFTRYSEKKTYKHADHLKKAIDRLEAEALEYLSGAKRGKGAQGDLFKPNKKLAAV